MKLNATGITLASVFRAYKTRPGHLSTTIYGIKNCATMKKARTWLDAHHVIYRFHDYKIDGIDRTHLAQWCKHVGWEILLNRAGTTFRNLPDSEKAGLNERKAIALMLAQPSLIKRPVLEIGKDILIGFKPDIYARQKGVCGNKPNTL